MAIKADYSDWRKYEKALLDMRQKAIPYAARDTLNDLAFGMKRRWQKNVKQAFTLRNKRTLNSIQVDKAKVRKHNTFTGMFSEVGSVAPWLETQEKGDTITAKGKHGKAIPRDAARVGGAPNRVLQKSKYLSSMSFKPRRGRNRSERNWSQISAARRNKKLALLELKGGGRAVYRITGRGKKKSFDLLWSFKHRSVTIKKEPTMARARERMDGLQGRLYARRLHKELEQVIRRTGLKWLG